MIGASIAIAATAALFVLFGVFAVADRDCDGRCAGCAGTCEFFEGREGET